MDQILNVGIIGCGNILGQYVKGCRHFEILNIVACADIVSEKAALLADPEVDIVLNLTIPRAHTDVSLAAVAQGKHIYSEKPLATKRKDGQQIIQKAKEAGVLVGCAPDTFLGAGLQASRDLIDKGAIGRPVAASAFFMSSGPERWHPNPAFFYEPGAGPLFDMAPYYLTALIHLLGPVEYLSADSHISFTERVAGHPDRKGEKIPVHVPTFVSSLLAFSGGVPATLITSFDVWASEVPRIEIYGSEGTLSVPDPNIFSGPVRLRQKDDEDWRKMPINGWSEAGRGIGLADMAHALVSDRPHRASGEMAFHVLDIMETIIEAGSSGQRVQLESSTVRPAPLPVGLPARRLDD
jgi:predicted dehydrogenase